MNRRNSGRSRRFASGPLVSVPTPTIAINFDAANVTKDGSNNITSIVSRGSVGETLVTSTIGRSPLWVATGSPNGLHPVMRQEPNGADGKWAFNTGVASDPFTVASGYTVFLVHATTTSGGSSGNQLWSYNTGAARGGWLLNVTGGNRLFEARTSAGTVKTATFGAYTSATWELWCIRNWGNGSDDVDSSSYFKARVNGSAVAVSGSPWFWLPTTRQEYFGSSTSTAGPVRIVAEARCYGAYFTDAQCALVESELMTKYGL